MVSILAFWLFCVFQTAARLPGLDWASLPVEREEFFEQGTTREYATTGRFGGIGMMYLSASRKVLIYNGLRRIGVPHLGQERDDLFEFKQESYTIRSLIRTDNGEYAFEAVNDGPFDRTVTGKVRYSLSKSGLFGLVDEFQMEEHGQTIKGMMNRYSLPKSAEAQRMLSKYTEVFFGGHYVALDLGK
jgi:hypothetical protein